MLVTRDVAKDPAQTKIIADYKHARRADRQQGHRPDHRATSPATGNAAGESALGDLIADAQLADPSVVGRRREAGRRVHEPGRHPRRPDRQGVDSGATR